MSGDDVVNRELRGTSMRKNRWPTRLAALTLVMAAACGADDSVGEFDAAQSVAALGEGGAPAQTANEEADTTAAPAELRANEISLVQGDDTQGALPGQSDLLVAIPRAKLTASDGVASDYFGGAVAISGNTAIVGASGNNPGNGNDAGAVYIFVKNGNSWTLQKKLGSISGGGSGAAYGSAVAIDGDTAVVGAIHDATAQAGDTGAVYVLVRNGTTWTQQQKVTASDGDTGDLFGFSVALSGDTLLVGARSADTTKGTDAGAAYVFVRNGTTWTQQQKVTASDGSAYNLFGLSVALSGDTAFVGCPNASTAGGLGAGAAYVFTRSGSTWTQSQKLTASDGSDSDFFGIAVALDSDSAVIGAYNDDPGGLSNAGSAYVFTRSGSTWSQQQKLVAADAAADDNFGRRIAMSGDTALVGAPLDDTAGGVNAGSAYVFTRSGSTWSQLTRIAASDGATSDSFGDSVGISGSMAIVGAYLDDIGTTTNAGSAHVFELFQQQNNGVACAAAQECVTGFCVDGVCCNSSCGGNSTSDCRACSVAAGAAVDGTCAPLSSGTVCRAATGGCDVAETCDGVSTACPANALAPAGTTCRAAAGDCDVAETCSGSSAACPADAFKAAGVSWRRNRG